MSRRADYGGGGFARPDEKMGPGRSHPCFGEKLTEPLTSTIKQTLKRVAARKRRQRDRKVSDESL